MSQAVLMRPDTEFIGRLVASGGGDLKKCYQCATCSVACELAPDDAPFPRKQMVEAQWGLKDSLMADPALWLCHNCGKCTERCPRGARPGDVLAALRREAIRWFAFPRFMGSLAANPKALPLLFLLPALIFTAVLLWVPAGTAPFEYASRFPAVVLEPLFFAVSGFALLAFAIGLVRFTRQLGPPGGSVARGLPSTMAEIAAHKRFTLCREPAARLGHLLTFWGFVGLALVGTITGIGTMAGVVHSPLPLLGALKLFANACAAVALVGAILLLVRRTADSARRAASTYFDWFFVWTLAGVLFTGIVSELLRLAHTNAMYAVYFVHLVLVFGLLAYAPYSKFAHFAYRTVALAHSGQSNARI